MPQIEEGKTIEKLYWDHVRKMSPAEKIRSSFAMFQSYYNQLSKRIKKDQPEISERELRILLAKRLYGGDPKTLKLIAMAEDSLHNNNTIITKEQ